MMLRVAPQIAEMTGTWQIIEQALAHKKPPRKVQWLADKLDVSAQVMTNWKTRRVPAARLRSIAEALGLSVDQLEGLAPLPWDDDAAWPFESISRERFERLDDPQRQKIEGAVLALVLEFERKQSSSGKSSDSSNGASTRRVA
jgi:hypothetical protein